jgi:predicted ester cyclase
MKTRREVVTNVARYSVAAAGVVSAAALAAEPKSTDSSSNLKGQKISQPDLTAFYKRYIAAINARHFEVVEQLVHEDVLMNGKSHKRADVLASLKGIADAVPNYVWGLQDLFVVEDRIAARLQNTGTPTKPFLGHKPTGASVNFMEFASYKVRDGRFAEMWFLMDAPTVAEQLRG